MPNRREFLAAATLAFMGCTKTVRTPSFRSLRENSMRNILFAMAQYYHFEGKMPNDVLAPDGTALWSWRVHLLRYLEREDLYFTADLTLPWTHPRNRPISETRLTVFETPGVPPGTTALFALRRGESPFPCPIGTRAPEGYDAQALLWLAAPERAIPWGQPGDIPFPVGGAEQAAKYLPETRGTVGLADLSFIHFPHRPHPQELEARYAPAEKIP